MGQNGSNWGLNESELGAFLVDPMTSGRDTANGQACASSLVALLPYLGSSTDCGVTLAASISERQLWLALIGW